MKNLLIYKDASIKKALELIKKSGVKGLVVINKNNQLIGSISDGDIRKAILKGTKLKNKILNIFNKKPHYLINKKYNQKKLNDLFYKKNFTIIPIIDEFKKVKKIITIKTIKKKRSPAKLNKNTLLKNIPCIIMAGGKGTRLEPFTDILPKPLIPVNKKPVIEHIIKNFENYGVKKFILSINYKAQILKAYFNELKPSYKLKFIYENKPLGTIGSLSKIKKSEAKNFFITNCDTISSINLISMYKFHLQNNYDLTILASSKKHQIPYGVCYARKNSDLIEIKEKPKFDFLVNAGLYLAKNSILNFVPKNKRYDFTDLVKILKSKNKKVGIFTVYENNWLDVGQWDEFKKTVSFFS